MKEQGFNEVQNNSMEQFIVNKVEFSNNFILKFFDSFPTPIVIVKKSGEIVAANSKTFEYYKCTNCQEVTEVLSDILSYQEEGAKLTENFLFYINEAIQKGSSNAQLKFKDQNSKDYLINLSLLSIDDNKGISDEKYIIVIIQDIIQYIPEFALNEKKAEFFKKFTDFIELMPYPVNVWDSDMNNIMCNSKVMDMFEISDVKEFLNEFYRFSPEFQPNNISSQEMSLKNIKKAIEEGLYKFKWMHQTINGDEIPTEITLIKAQLYEGEHHVIGFVHDLRPEFSDENAIHDEYEYYFLDRIPEKTLLKKATELSDEWFFSIDTRTATVRYYGSMISDIGAEKGIADKFSVDIMEGIIHQDDLAEYHALANNMMKGIYEPIDIRFIQPDGLYRYYRLVYQPIFDSNGLPVFIVGRGIDVNEEKVMQERMKLDALTECYNLTSIENAIHEYFEQEPESKNALLFVDINNFRSINESIGHYRGDELLQQLTARLKSLMKKNDIIGRIGGDEFIVLLKNIKDEKKIGKRTEKISNHINQPYMIDGERIDLSIRMGVSIFSKDGNSYAECLEAADKAVYVAKIKGDKWVIYDDILEDVPMRDISKNIYTQQISGAYYDHDLISTVFNILYEKNSDEFSINAALRYIGQTYDVDRCFIFEAIESDNVYTNTFEWCKDKAQSTGNIKYFPKSKLTSLFENVTAGGTVQCNDIDEIGWECEFVDVLKSHNVKSFAHAQIKKDEKVTFFVGLEDNTTKRVWSEKILTTLQYIAKILSIILQAKQMHKKIEALTEYSRNSAFVADNTENLIYITDPDTYEMIHMNNAALSAFDLHAESEWKNKKCHELLYAKNTPCEFCTNDKLESDNIFEWTFKNPILNRTYLYKDRLIEMDNKLVKLQVATDITQLVELEDELTNKFEEQQLLLECIKLLMKNDSPDVLINNLLKLVSQFYDSKKGIIYQVMPEENQAMNTYIWANPEFKNDEEDNKPIPLNVAQYIGQALAEGRGLAYISRDDEKYRDSEFVASMNKEFKSIMLAAISDAKGNGVGIIGMINATKNLEKAWLLQSVSAFIADFLEKNKLITTLNKLSYFDTLTGVKNRHSYRQALQQINDEKVSSLGVAYVDISGLSAINEAKGTSYGDRIINRLATILAEIFGDNIFRVGGDEFVVLEKNIDEVNFEEKIQTLKETFYQEKDFRASVGFTWNNNIGEYEYGEIATGYNVNSDNKGYTEMLCKNLEREIANGKYVVYLQPQIDIKTEEFDGAEALIRRLDANGDIQPPISFIPFYEKEGIISMIDLFVCETVCASLYEWNKKFIDRHFRISVNFSRVTIMESDIVEKISEICDKYAVDRSQIIIEITETISRAEDAVFSKIISNFKDAGFSVSLDDFGSGYSNLSALKLSNFDEIKIDMGLTRDLHLNERSHTLTKVALNLCREFDDVIAVAEGIENRQQFDILKLLDCDKGQGYFFDKPMNIKDFEFKYINNI